jgi:metal-sulfur cluster biosynthetic enzyme
VSEPSSTPTRSSVCPMAREIVSQLRRRVGQSGGRRKRRARFAPQEVSKKPVIEQGQ